MGAAEEELLYSCGMCFVSTFVEPTTIMIQQLHGTKQLMEQPHPLMRMLQPFDTCDLTAPLWISVSKLEAIDSAQGRFLAPSA